MASSNSDAGPLLRVLGSLDLTLPGGPDPGGLLRQPKRAAVLVYVTLASPSEFVTRDRLMAVFWPASDSGGARTSLRQTLTFLRRHLPEGTLLRRGDHSVGVSGSALACDALRFQSLVRSGDAKGAMDWYAGDLLPSFHVRGSPAFGQWLERERDRYRAQAADAAWELAVEGETADRKSDAAFWAKRSLELTGLDERAVARTARFLAELGDRVGALRVYHGFRERLLELGLDPPRSMEEDLRELLGPDPGTGHANGTPFSGRRTGGGRRHGSDRRSGQEEFEGPDRRSGHERRSMLARRSGLDRRNPRDQVED